MIEIDKKVKKVRRDILKVIWQSILLSHPDNTIKNHLKLHYNSLTIDNNKINLDAYDNIYVIGAGKASAHMAKAIENIFMRRITGGLICVKYGHGIKLHNILLAEAGHPVPDENSYSAAKKTLEIVQKCTHKDLIICLMSGGASSIWALPYAKIPFTDKQRCYEVLLGSGADIHEINTVRKHISRIKGGRLAQAAHSARLITLAISDVIGDDFSSIGSGPSTGDPTTFKDAMDVFTKYNLTQKIPKSIFEHTIAGLKGEIKETPKPNDRIFRGNIECIIASNKQFLEIAKQTGENLGYNAKIVSNELSGEASEVGKQIIENARKIRIAKKSGYKPTMLLFGGETTVTLKGDGKGGRNQELTLSAALEMTDLKDVVIASMGTDGTDGPTDAAGAFADTTTIARGNDIRLNAKEFLDRNNSYGYFDRLGDLIKTGPTGTNVMDIQAVIIY
ncbi:MAG: glycerate kinase [candidate division Zixibacteria bacterium]|nr:glycerate kinase [candidate division Zixibacteria bacterium]